MSEGPVILLLGASGAVGSRFLERTSDRGVRIIAISRRAPAHAWPHVTWIEHDLERVPADVRAGTLVSLGPIAHALSQIEAVPGIGRVIALSSASTRFKRHSPDRRERRQMAAIDRTEQRLGEVCRQREIGLTLLKTTLIYGGQHDANISRIAALSRRLPLVPVAGDGLRQPVHADDLARLVLDCIVLGGTAAGCWLLGGGETLTYPDMMRRVAAAEGRQARLVRLPAWLMSAALKAAHLAGGLRDITPAMIQRQKMDLVVDDAPARETLAWNPRPFRPGGE